MVTRMGTAGKVPKLTCELPLPQTNLSQLVGLSVVHLNRTFRNPEASDDLAGFDDTYLHLKEKGNAEPTIA